MPRSEYTTGRFPLAVTLSVAASSLVLTNSPFARVSIHQLSTLPAKQSMVGDRDSLQQRHAGDDHAIPAARHTLFVQPK